MMTTCPQVLHKSNILHKTFRFFAYYYQNKIHTDHVSHYGHIQHLFVVSKGKYTQMNCVRVYSVKRFRTLRGCRKTGQ